MAFVNLRALLESHSHPSSSNKAASSSTSSIHADPSNTLGRRDISSSPSLPFSSPSLSSSPSSSSPCYLRNLTTPFTTRTDLDALLRSSARKDPKNRIHQSGSGSNSLGGHGTSLGAQGSGEVCMRALMSHLDALSSSPSSSLAYSLWNNAHVRADYLVKENTEEGSGGIVPASIVELCGKPSRGKTTVALSAAVEALGENMSSIVAETSRRERSIAAAEAASASTSTSPAHPAPPSAVIIGDERLVLPLPTTHVVWVSSHHHHAFSPTLLLNALEDCAVDALEAFYNREGEEAQRRHNHGGQSRKKSDDADDDGHHQHHLFNYHSEILKDPLALARHTVDNGLHFIGGVDTPHKLIVVCEELVMLKRSAKPPANVGGGGNGHREINAAAAASSSSPPLLLLATSATRVLFIFDCLASCLTSIENAPLNAAVLSATVLSPSGVQISAGGGNADSNTGDEGRDEEEEKEAKTANIPAAADIDLTVGNATTLMSAAGTRGGGGGQSYQYTVHSMKLALHNLVNCFNGYHVPVGTEAGEGAGGWGGGGVRGATTWPAASAMLLTNLVTSNVGPYPARPLGGTVWQTTSDIKVHLSLVAEDTTSTGSAADGDAEDGGAAPVGWKHVFTLLP